MLVVRLYELFYLYICKQVTL